MQRFRKSPPEMAASLWRNSDLVMALTKREVMNCNHGSKLGVTWSFFNPLLREEMKSSSISILPSTLGHRASTMPPMSAQVNRVM